MKAISQIRIQGFIGRQQQTQTRLTRLLLTLMLILSILAMEKLATREKLVSQVFLSDVFAICNNCNSSWLEEYILKPSGICCK